MYIIKILKTISLGKQIYSYLRLPEVNSGRARLCCKHLATRFETEKEAIDCLCWMADITEYGWDNIGNANVIEEKNE